MLFHLIYVSTEVAPMTDEDLVELLRQARATNEKHQLTGMLLYKNSHFMQVLEGDESSVMEIFEKIIEDRRHKNIDTLRAEYISHRSFPDWTMGFRNIDTLGPAALPGYTRFLESDFRSGFFSEDSIEAHAMLVAFKDNPDAD